MVRAVVLAVVLLAATGCSWMRGADTRMLPRDRNAEVVYVALGDSTVEGIGASRPETNYVSRLHARLRERYPNARLVNLGDGGATSRDVLRRQLDRAVELKPQLLTLSVGPNDITSRVPVAQYAENMDAILGRLAADTDAVIVINLLPDLAVTPRFRGGAAAVVGRLSSEFNEALAEVAARQMRELLLAVTSRVRGLAEEGRPVEWIQDSLRFDDIRRKVPAWADKEHDEDWDYIVRTVIERAWRGVRGQG